MTTAEPSTRPVPPTTQPVISTTTQPAEDISEVIDSDVEVPATQPVAVVEDGAEPAEPSTFVYDDLPTEVGGGDVDDGERAVAALFQQLAAGTLLAGDSVQTARQAEALTAMAVRLAPDDVRLARDLVDVRLTVSGIEPAVEALDHYRRLEPFDHLAQIQYVDLSAELLQSVDQRLSYFSRLVDLESLPEEVRSHAAVSAATMLRERLEDQAALEMVERAIELDEFNPQARLLQYFERVSGGADREQVVESLVGLLRANVAQPVYLQAMARELSSAGLVDLATPFFAAAGRAYAGQGQRPPVSLSADHAAALISAARPREAQGLLQQVSVPEGGLVDPAVTEAVNTLDLLAALVSPPEASQTFIGRMNGRLAGLLADPRPAQPEAVDDLPDVAAIAAQAREAGPREAVVAGVLLADRAWLDLYAAEQPTDAGLLDAITLVVPEQSPVVTRLRGWQAWREGDIDSAKEKLESVADADPLSRLGLLLIRQEEGEDVVPEARELLQETPAGLASATIAATFDRQGLVAGGGESTPAIREAAEAFPLRLLDLIDPANARRFYSLAARPEKVTHVYGEPLLVRLTLRNIGPDPLTIGPAGVLSEQYRLDAQIRGLIQQRVPRSAQGTWAGRVKLKQGERLQQVVRLDGPQLAALLDQNPLIKLTMFGEVVSNPVTVLVPPADDPEGQPQPQYAVASAGQAVGFQQVVDRLGLPIDLTNAAIVNQIQLRLSQLRDGEPVERIRAADATLAQLGWLSNRIVRLQEEGGAAEEIQAWQQMGGSMNDALRRAAVVSDESVTGPQGVASAWVRYRAASASPAGDRLGLIAPALGSPEPAARMIGLLGLSRLAAQDPQALALIRTAEDDSDPTIRRFVAATLRQASDAGE